MYTLGLLQRNILTDHPARMHTYICTHTHLYQDCCNGTFSLTIRREGGLRNYPPTSDAASTCGGPESCKQVGLSSESEF